MAEASRDNHNNSPVVAEMAAVLADVTDEATADRCAVAIAAHFTGCQVYFPRDGTRRSLENEIRRLWNGLNAEALIRRFGVSHATFYRIVKPARTGSPR